MFGKNKEKDGAAKDAKRDAKKVVYKVIYKGGLPELPKSKTGEIRLALTEDAFVFSPTIGSKKFWDELTVPYSTINQVEIVARTVSSVEGLLGGINSRQLNQDNNLNFSYANADGQPTLLRVEMLTGVTVMAQAGKCREFMDYLRAHGILDKFKAAPAATTAAPAPSGPSLTEIAEMYKAGVLTEEEFTAAKAKALGI
jgi:hypothetical protein